MPQIATNLVKMSRRDGLIKQWYNTLIHKTHLKATYQTQCLKTVSAIFVAQNVDYIFSGFKTRFASGGGGGRGLW